MRVFITSLVATLITSASAFAQERPLNVPTLSEWSMVAMIGAFGVIGALVLRKRLTKRAV